MSSSSKLQYYVLICDKKKKKKFLGLITDYGAVCVQTNYARGSAKAGALACALGFDVEEHKVVISGLIPTSKAEELTETLKTQYNFGGKNTGIAFSINVEGLGL